MSVLSGKFRNFAAGTTMLLAAALPFNANAQEYYLGPNGVARPVISQPVAQSNQVSATGVARPPQVAAAPKPAAQPVAYQKSSFREASAYSKQTDGVGFGVLFGNQNGYTEEEAIQIALFAANEGMKGLEKPYKVFVDFYEGRGQSVYVYAGEGFAGDFALEEIAEKAHIPAVEDIYRLQNAGKNWSLSHLGYN